MSFTKNWEPKEIHTGIYNPKTGKEYILSDYYVAPDGNKYFTHKEALEIWRSIPGWGPCTNEFHRVLNMMLWDRDKSIWAENVLGTGLDGFEYMTQRLGYELEGSRELTAAELTNVGCSGYSWSSSVSGIYGVYLLFNATYLGPSFTGYRALGLQVRCLKNW